MSSPRLRPLLAAPAALALGLSLSAPGLAIDENGGSYTNPVSSSFADTYADPAVIQAKDGWWYAYATADPLRAGDEPGIGHVARTKDWDTWEYRGTIFDETNRPSWAEPNAGLWAPDVRYIDGQYVFYFTVTDTTLNPGGDSAIGVATSDSPEGPWVSAQEPIVAPRSDGGGGFYWTFDPAGFTSSDGRQWLYYGSYFGGLHVTEVSADGLRPVGAPTQVGQWDRYEGGYVVEHQGWYYLTASSANCCAGPATGYSVFSGRSQDPRGPFLDAEGLDLNASVTGGTTMLTQNGNDWIGAGHHAVMTDAQGRDFVVYHALDKDEPWLTEPFGINRRPMLLDRLDWIDGWPRTNAGAGPSDDARPLPVLTSLLGGDPAAPATAFDGMTAGSDPQAGPTGVVGDRATSISPAPGGTARVRLDVRADEPLTVVLGAHPKQVRVTVDPAAGELRSEIVMGRRAVTSDTAPLPAGDGWRTLVVEVDGPSRIVSAEVSAEDLNDPMAITGTSFPGFMLRSAPVVLEGEGTAVDNLTVQTLARDASQTVPVPQPGEVLFTDSFDGDVADGWSWVRPQDDATVSGGDLVWPLRSVDLVGSGNTGALLLREPPEGDWILETDLTLDLGEGSVRNYQQAGLVVHEDDDDFARLGTVAIWGTRTVEFGRELPAAPGEDTIFGGAIIGAPAPTMSMRLAHSSNDEGEHVYRAGTSRDGQSWVWGAAWTMPAEASPRVGLYAGGGEEPQVAARFHEVTLYRTAP